MITYLEQLDIRAARSNLDLVDVCERSGVAVSTLRRWRAGTVTCREGTVRKLLAEMDRMDAERQKKKKSAA